MRSAKTVAEAITDPLRGPEPIEIPLPNAPLVRVLCQVRFSEVLAITKKEFVASFHEAIRNDYPILTNEERRTVQLGPNNINHAQTENIWRFFDAQERWRVSLATNFISIETLVYWSRADFISKLAKVLDSVSTEIRPAFATRVGIRYVDRVDGAELEQLSKLVRPEVMGVADSVLIGDLNHSLSITDCNIAEGKLFARWGRLAPGATHDPDAMEPIGEPCWFLDLDASKSFGQNEQRFETQSLRLLATALATRVYTVFRWTVTEEFLRTYGADL